MALLWLLMLLLLLLLLLPLLRRDRPLTPSSLAELRRLPTCTTPRFPLRWAWRPSSRCTTTLRPSNTPPLPNVLLLLLLPPPMGKAVIAVEEE